MNAARDIRASQLPQEESGARLEAILDTAVDAIITTDSTGRIEMFNPAAENMFGYSTDEVIGRNVSMLMPQVHAARHDDYMSAGKKRQTPRVIGRRREITALRRDGSEFPIELALSSVEVRGQRVFTAMIHDISRRRAAENELAEYREHLEHMVNERTKELEEARDKLHDVNSRLEQMVRIDELTGVGNRRAFDERLALEWRRQRRNRKPLSLILCDIDDFKAYNDHYGHPAGDACLREIGAAMRSCFQRATEFIARYGGEEFAVILANTSEQEACESAERLRATVQALGIEQVGLGPGRFVTISAGVACVMPDGSGNADSLVVAADAALYRAKERGRNRVESVAEPVTC